VRIKPGESISRHDLQYSLQAVKGGDTRFQDSTWQHGGAVRRAGKPAPPTFWRSCPGSVRERVPGRELSRTCPGPSPSLSLQMQGGRRLLTHTTPPCKVSSGWKEQAMHEMHLRGAYRVWTHIGTAHACACYPRPLHSIIPTRNTHG
jgi:hypothetical protein